jgi:hypothetical protein
MSCPHGLSLFGEYTFQWKTLMNIVTNSHVSTDGDKILCQLYNRQLLTDSVP